MAQLTSLLPSFGMDSDGEAPSIHEATGSVSRVPGRGKQYWSVQFRAPQNRKHKTWDDDGVLEVSSGHFVLYDTDGRKLTTGKVGVDLKPNLEVKLGAREIRIDTAISHSDYFSGICFGKQNIVAPASEPPRKKFKPLLPTTNIPVKSKVAIQSTLEDPLREDEVERSRSPQPAPVKPPSVGLLVRKAPVKQIVPLHDPEAPGAVVLKEPNEFAQRKFNKHNLPSIPVVVDPLLSKHLRPHQIEGVKFLYECIIGSRKHEGQGGILADDMGLGKTLQTIALIWTVLRQTPYGGAGPLVGKVLIVCPVTLINNWKAEFRKWLGRDRLGIFIGDKDKTVIKQFINSKIHQVLIIGYEKLRTVIEELAYCNPPIGLIVCDEGHRLKSANAKSHRMFDALKCRRRIILSGTPIQNDLGEFHAMADFCNPGLLDAYSSFKKVFEGPIMKSRSPDATAKERELGLARMERLLTTANSFVLRREGSILSKYLPPKFEFVVFVKATRTQRRIFSSILQPENLNSVIGSSTARSLALITRLTKLSTCPSLVLENSESSVPSEAEGDDVISKAIRDMGDISPRGNHDSGKMIFLCRMLEYLRESTSEKCVIVSHYTSTLNVIEKIATSKKYGYLRLDGQTPAAKRIEYVDAFNKSTQAERFLFLLSAKAGGVGLNLIGASRLVLVDSDWNPSHDNQAMGRIHRDGQKRPVFIYRLLTAGTIDEKIFQRQITKMGLSDSMLKQKTNNDAMQDATSIDTFTRSELRDIFTHYDNTPCHTHDLLCCPCPLGNGTSESCDEPQRGSMGEDLSSSSDEDENDEDGPGGQNNFMFASQIRPKQFQHKEKQRQVEALKSLSEWTHINCLYPGAITALEDEMLGQFVCRPFNQAEEAGDSEVEALTLDEMNGGSPLFVFGRRSCNASDDIEAS